MQRWICFLTIVFVSVNCTAATIKVDQDGTGDYTTIQEAISAAVEGDTVIVAEGTYYENINFGGKNITLTSTSPNDEYVVANTIIDANSIGSVITCESGENPDTLISGFVITNGKGTHLEGSIAGGGMYCNASDPVIKNCIFRNNSAIDVGGGFFCVYGSKPTINDCKFSDNAANLGAGIYSWGSQPEIIDCTFSNNEAVYRGGGIILDQGGISIVDCTFNGNSAPLGGGIHFYFCNATIENCEFNSNSAGKGGGISYSNCSSPDLNNCLFNSNSASYGAGVYSFASGPAITNCTFSNNQALYRGGGIFSDSTQTPSLVNCIMWGNTASTAGSEIYVYNTSVPYVPKISYCNIEGCGGSGAGWNLPLCEDGGNNIDTDPLFVIGPNGNHYLSQIAAGQGSDSLCVDAGSDMAPGLSDRTTRSDHVRDIGTIDMGYHYTIYPGDINFDKKVNMLDLAIMSSQWQDSPGIPSADISSVGGAGIVNIYDLRMLAEYWLTP